MRNITKIFLLLVVAFVIYLLWPRHPDLKGFNPGELASLEVGSWQAEKAGKGFGAWLARYRTYTSEYHFAPISSYRVAHDQAAALDLLKLTVDPNSPEAEAAENRTLNALTEKYTEIKQATNGAFDPSSMAREEFSWRSLEQQDNSADQAAAALSRLLAGLYGGSSADFKDVATNLVYARALILKEGTAAPDGADPAATALTTARDAYTSLKEIAATPITAPEAAQ